MKGAPFNLQGLEFCPVAPPGVKGLRSIDGSAIFWYKDRTVKWAADGTVLTWWTKPTISDAINSLNTGNYYQFHNDGTVFCRFNGSPYFWSKPHEASCENGTVLNLHICQGDEYFLEGEDCYCDRCVECGDLSGYGEYFCSKTCMVLFRCD